MFSRTQGTFAVTRGIDTEIAARVAGVSTIDPARLVCDDQQCSTERDGIVLYRDAHHLSLRFAASLATVVGDSIGHLIAIRH